MTRFSPHLQILPPSQRTVWDELVEIPAGFILYGGTAVALHLGHRQSVDFDFFGWRSFAPLDFAVQLNMLRGGVVMQSEPNTLTINIDRDGPVKLSFFGEPQLQECPDDLKHRLVSAVRRVDLANLPALEFGF